MTYSEMYGEELLAPDDDFIDDDFIPDLFVEVSEYHLRSYAEFDDLIGDDYE